ncbi:tRNA(m(1)G37)methyltransferase [Claviceps sp. Clav32 group G5]|nr:tRNA(m(1)G37)methyltransferase [Claviceps sp. Clav32 group G5]KAG6047694.1 tRNA(m(1)G37)methyltransferase [Claviceps sp. Clav50 group G5]
MEGKRSELEMNFFRAPAAARALKTLDRSLYTRMIPTSVACVRENRNISKYRQMLQKTNEILQLEKVNCITADPDAALAAQGRKCIILTPEFKGSVPETWSDELREAAREEHIRVEPFELTIGYDLWSYYDVMASILPEDLHDEIPTGFNTAGHVAHLNIRGQYLPYKHIMGQIIIDKNPTIRTVINKVDTVGTESEFRTFSYEVIAGPDDMAVEVTEAACVFKFDYSKVYWNSKLQTEHQRIRDMFQPGEVVADVMAGVGPFAVPAGKKHVFVWANDKNPNSYTYLVDAIKRNKVTQFVKPFEEDGHAFIRLVADRVLEASQLGECAVVYPPRKVSRSAPPASGPTPTRIPVPPTIAHYVMNLPASAIEFLHNFKGLYQGREELFAPHTDTKLPLIHVHCFAVKNDEPAAIKEICQRIYREIGVALKAGDAEKEGEVAIHEVRDVAPKKTMFCATFRLPREVAFAARV